MEACGSMTARQEENRHPSGRNQLPCHNFMLDTASEQLHGAGDYKSQIYGMHMIRRGPEAPLLVSEQQATNQEVIAKVLLRAYIVDV